MRAQIDGGRVVVLGWRADKPDHRDRLLLAPRAADAPPAPVLPPSADLRAKCPPVVDQGTIGSCTANAGCELMEFLEARAAADPAFSRLFVYFYTRQVEGTAPTDDAGAEIRDVMKALAQFGACYEPTWPYDPPEQRFALEPSAAAVLEAAQHKALFYYRCPDLLTVRASIAQGFPVELGFSVPDNMMSADCAQTGEVHYPAAAEGFQGGHAVMVVGYDDAKVIGGETGALLCQNSWGPGWGVGGFFWLPYRFVNDGLASDMWTLRQAQV